MNLSAEQADLLLDKLSNDDAFRTLFAQDPRRALASIGHAEAATTATARGAWMCMSVKQLASKEAIAASRDALRKQLVSAQAGQNPIHLETQRS